MYLLGPRHFVLLKYSQIWVKNVIESLWYFPPFFYIKTSVSYDIIFNELLFLKSHMLFFFCWLIEWLCLKRLHYFQQVLNNKFTISALYRTELEIMPVQSQINKNKIDILLSSNHFFPGFYNKKNWTSLNLYVFKINATKSFSYLYCVKFHPNMFNRN